MTVLFSQYWDVMPGKFGDYSNFIMTYYNSALERIGIKLVGGYYVTVGMGPRIIAVCVAQNLVDLENALASSEFDEITGQLQEYVTHYHSKILTPTGRVKMDGYKIQTGLWKFNQYWNIVQGLKERIYTEFIADDFLPSMEKIGIKVTAGWRVVVGSGPSILAESSAGSLVEIARAIDTDEFRQLMVRLKGTYVKDYHSRILAPTGRIDLPYLMKEMMAHF